VISQLRTAPNQLTLLRLLFIPFIVISILDHRYGWALGLLVLAGFSDCLDGILARLLKQKTALGMLLDPIADKLLLSTLFLVLSVDHKIPWKVTVLVFSRDLGIVLTSAVVWATTSIRDFPPSFFGKANTTAQILTVFFVLLDEVAPSNAVLFCKQVSLWATVALTVLSAVHYVFRLGRRLRAQEPPPAAAT
jgi:cardiolipin synthase (CMP-forming)